MKTETYVCQACGADVVRPVAPGQRPKWCDTCRSRGAKKQVECAHCGVMCWTWHGGRYCSRSCAATATARPVLKPKPAPKTRSEREAVWRERRSDIRAGFEDRDWPRLSSGIKARTVADGDCWRWTGRIRDGYPYVSIAGKWFYVHRLSLMAKHGADLGSQHAHHICANTQCVNPDHLQPVTHRENVAEMLARQSYLARIRELEAALSEFAPGHPLLAVVSVA